MEELQESVLVLLKQTEPSSGSITGSGGFHFCGGSYDLEDLKPKIFLAVHLLKHCGTEASELIRKVVCQTEIKQGAGKTVFHCLDRGFVELNDLIAWCEEHLQTVSCHLTYSLFGDADIVISTAHAVTTVSDMQLERIVSPGWSDNSRDSRV